MAKFKFITKPTILFAERWTPEKGTSVEGVYHCPATETTPEYYYTVNTHGNQCIVHSGDYIIPEQNGQGHYPCAPDIFASKYDGMLPYGRVLPVQAFLVLDLFSPLLEELFPGASEHWSDLIRAAYESPKEAPTKLREFRDFIASQGVDTGSLDMALSSIKFFDPANN